VQRGVGERSGLSRLVTPAVLLLMLGLALALAVGGASGASGTGVSQPLWQRCDGGAEDLTCSLPRGIGVSPANGDLYIADSANARVVQLTAWGQFVRAFGWGAANGAAEAQVCTVAASCQPGLGGGGAGQFKVPQGIAVDAGGNVYVFDDVTNRVQKFDSEGHFLLMIGGEVNKTKSEEGGSTEAQRNLCAAGTGDVCQEGKLGTGKGQFNVSTPTSSIVAAPFGPVGATRVYVGDKSTGGKGRIQVFDAEGHYLEDVPNPEGIGASALVASLAPGPTTGAGTGTLYAARAEAGNPVANVVRLNVATGKKVGSECSIAAPTALAIAAKPEGLPSGNLFVFNKASGQVQQFGTASTASCPEKEAPFAKGDVSTSSGLAASTACLEAETVSEQGPNVYLASSNFTDSFVRAYGPAPSNRTLCHKPALPPEVLSQYAVSVGASEAELRAEINPRFSPDTAYRVQYGTAACVQGGGWEAPCVASQPVAPASLGAQAVDFPTTTPSVFLGSLQPATAYRYRFVATSHCEEAEPEATCTGAGAEHGFTTYPAPAVIGGCPNEALRGGASAALPDCRAYEMVSPVGKAGGDVLVQEDLNGPAERSQSATSGDRFTYSSLRAFPGAEGAPFSSQYVAERGAGGWANHNISPPRGQTVGLTSGGGGEFEFFSADLCNAWLDHYTGTAPPLAGGVPFGSTLYRRSDCGASAGNYAMIGKEFLGGQPVLKGASADGEMTIFAEQGHLTQDVAVSTSEKPLGCSSAASVPSASFQWLRNGEAIAGATSASYAIKPAEDAGKTIQCRLTVSGEGGLGSTQVANPAWVVSPYPATAPPLAPAQIAAPATNAPLSVGGAGGQLLSCGPGNWGGSPAFAYRWYRNGAPLAGATAPQYTVQAPDLASAAAFQCEVRAENAGGAVVESSDLILTSPAPEVPVARPDSFGDPFGSNQVVYAAGANGLRSVCVLPGGEQSRGCMAGRRVATDAKLGGGNLIEGALSADGSRAFWTDGVQYEGRIYLRENPTEPQSALADGQASGAGKRTSGSEEVSEVSTAAGAFAVGQQAIGEGIPFGTTITAVGPTTLTLSAKATKTTAKSSKLEATSECIEADMACTLGVSEAVEGGPEPEGGGQFWAASADGSRVLFAIGSERENPEDLYELDLEDGPPDLIAKGVRGVLGTSRDLSHVYFLSTETLTGEGEEEANSEGAFAQAGRPNLYLYRSGGGVRFIATLSAADARYDYKERPAPSDSNPYLRAARVSGDGESAAFISAASLTKGYDNTDVASGAPDAELYRYDAETGRLSCASCVPSGARPLGQDLGGDAVEPEFWAAAKLPFTENELHPSQSLSEDGNRLFFESFGPLASADTNGHKDVYEWEAPGAGSCSESNPAFSPQDEGCLFLISSGQSPQDSELLDASPEGRDVFIRTGSSLATQDPGSFDVYDARAGGGFPAPPAPPQPCEGEACQSPPPPPGESTPSSFLFNGPGNPKQHKHRKHKHKHRVKHRRRGAQR
jgi:hypothetical protein